MVNSLKTVLRKIHSELGRPLRVACDWDEVVYMTEYYCLKEAIERDSLSVSPETLNAMKKVKGKNFHLYPHGSFWEDSKRYNKQNQAKEIFFNPSLFTNPGILDSFDTLIEGVTKGWIEQLVFMTYSPEIKGGLDRRKKEIFERYFGELSKHYLVSMVIIPYNATYGVPYEKGYFINLILLENDILIDNHLHFAKWTAMFSSRTKYFLVPKFNQEINSTLAKVLLGGRKLIFYSVNPNKSIQSFEYPSATEIKPT